MVRVYLVLWETTKKPPKWLQRFAFPPATNESSCCSTSSPAFGVVSALDFGHSNRCVMASHCLNLHFPDDILWGHLFVCLFAICISSLARRSVKVFCPFFKPWFSFSHCWALGVLFFFLILLIYLFIAVLGLRFCARAFSSWRQAGATLHRGARTSRYRGLSCCGAQVPDAQAQ